METLIKRTMCVVAVASVLAVTAHSQSSSQAIDLLLKSYSGRAFAQGVIPKADLDRIVKAGIRSPSANNKQPWFFTVVQTLRLGAKLVNGLKSGEVLVIVSAEGDANDPRVALDCGLAAENIYLAAQALGYASRIYTGPIDTLNERYKDDFGIPPNRTAVVLVRIGKVSGKVDAESRASPRKKEQDIVIYR